MTSAVHAARIAFAASAPAAFGEGAAAARTGAAGAGVDFFDAMTRSDALLQQTHSARAAPTARIFAPMD